MDNMQRLLIFGCISFLTLMGCEKRRQQITNVQPIENYDLICPSDIPAGIAFPIVMMRSDLNPRIDVTESFSAKLDDNRWLDAAEFELKRGMGSTVISARDHGNHFLEITNKFGYVTNRKWIGSTTDRDTARFTRGWLYDEELQWDSTQIVHIMDNLSISSDQVLNIGAGAIILINENVNIFINGEIHCHGTPESPILFSAFDQPWGMIHHSGVYNHYKYTFFTGGGGMDAYQFGHSESQPVLRGDNCQIDFENVYICDNVGKAMGFQRSKINLKNSLIARCDTGGELVTTLATIEDCWFMDIPDSSPDELDDDNDALYISGAWAAGRFKTKIYNSVFINGKDDGIESNSANVLIESCVISGYANEGIVASNLNGIEVFNTLITKCNQGIEAGIGSPAVKVDHSLLMYNEVGLRFGDWSDRACTGSLFVTNTVSVTNSSHNVWNFVVPQNGPQPGAIDISFSMVDHAEYDSLEGCLPGTPTFDLDLTIEPDQPGYKDADDGLNMGLLPWGSQK